MSLRSRLIEAGASAIAGDRGEWTEDMREEFFQDAEIALDAFLDVLEANAGEWSGAAARRHPFGKGPVSTPKTVIDSAIAALRDTETGPEETASG